MIFLPEGWSSSSTSTIVDRISNPPPPSLEVIPDGDGGCGVDGKKSGCREELGSSSKPKPNKSQVNNTVIAALAATFGSFCLGTVLTWSALVLADPTFREQFPEIGDGSWVASLQLLGAVCSAPVSGYLTSKLGRRRKMLLSVVPLVAGWLFIAFAPSARALYLGRFLTGFFAGAFSVSIPAYVSEVSEDSNRGALSATFAVMGYSGILFTFVLGAFVNWFVLSLVLASLPILFFFGMLFMPETPRYLIQTGKPEEARAALKWLRKGSSSSSSSSPSQIEQELSTIAKSVSDATTMSSQSTAIRDLFSARVLKPMGICMMLFTIGQFSGFNAICLYTVQIFRESGSDVDEYLASIIFGITQAVAVALVPIFLVERMGRRKLLISSGVIMALSLLLLGGFFHLKEVNGGGTPPSHLGWLPLAALVLTTIGYCLGFGPLPWVLTSEILPNDAKELTSVFVSISYYGFSFVSGKTFPELEGCMGYMGVYLLSSGICLAGAIIVYLFVPETKGRSSEEIQRFFSNPQQVAQVSEEGGKEGGGKNPFVGGLDNSAFEKFGYV